MKKTTISSADLVVLSILAEEPMHGYRIVSELDRRDAKDWAEISRPQVYYSLKKLSKLKYISTATDSEESQGPDRDKYRINKSGREAMNDALCMDSWAQQRPPQPFLTWMALSSHLSPSATRKIIEARQVYLLKELDREIKTFKGFEVDADKMRTAGRLMVSLTVEHFRLELKWLAKVLRDLPKTRS